MLVVDASALFEVVADTPGAAEVRAFMREDDDLAAPHLVDAEVLAPLTLDRRLAAAPGLRCAVTAVS